MASLNLSTNGPSISKSYQSVVNAPPPTGPAGSSPTYGQWAIFSVSAPLANAFQDSSNKESVLKVQSTGEGELVDLIDEFSDGRIQFAYLKLKDSNTGLPKNALIAWCGEGVPERTKGYFTSHLTAVAKLLHGYHVQITARSDRDLTPESIIKKVADASGSKYSNNDAPPPISSATKPVVASKPAFTPTQSSGAPLINRSVRRADANVDEDGWGADAPQVTRTQLEKVQPAYQPTKVNMRDLTSQKPPSSSFAPSTYQDNRPDVVKGAYQPVGKVDIAEIRRRAKETGELKDERPETVKGTYEPVGKVDIAAIRARAQQPEAAPVAPVSTGRSSQEDEQSPSLAQRSAAFSSGGDAERLTSMPKPRVANKFGGSGNFSGTRAPVPGGFESKAPVAATAPIGAAGKNFADQGGKTPAQIWAEKKARERGTSGSGTGLPTPGPNVTSPMTAQTSGGGGWESGYAGKKWAPVSIPQAGKSSIPSQNTGDAEEHETEDPSSPGGGVSSIRDRFSGAPPMGAPAAAGYERSAPQAPEPETSTKPNRGIPIPGLSQPTPREEDDDDEPAAPSLPTPPRQPRSPTPPTPQMREASPIRIAMPVSKATPVAGAYEEAEEPAPPMPTKSIGRAIPEPESEDDEPDRGPDLARQAAQTGVAATLGQTPAATPASGRGERARAEYDYDAAEDNEIPLREGEIVTDIEKLDPDWWQVTNDQGQTGLVPSNYLVIIEDEDEQEEAPAPVPTGRSIAAPPATQSKGVSAVALYDYEAAEDNEISFPEDAVIENITFPDEDWWHGEYSGKEGLFPAAYVKLEE